MSRHGKLLFLTVILLIIYRVGFIVRDVYLAQTYGTLAPPEVIQHAEFVSILAIGLINLCCAIWVYREAKSHQLQKWLFSVFALVTGFISIIVYYGYQIYVGRRANET